MCFCRLPFQIEPGFSLFPYPFLNILIENKGKCGFCKKLKMLIMIEQALKSGKIPFQRRDLLLQVLKLPEQLLKSTSTRLTHASQFCIFKKILWIEALEGLFCPFLRKTLLISRRDACTSLRVCTI